MNSDSTERLVGSVFVVMIVLANILATKIATVPVLGLSVTAGVFPIAIGFLCTDILSENYGEETAKEWVKIALAVLVIGWAVIYLAVYAPPAPSWDGQAAFGTTLTASMPIVTASFITFGLSQTIDVHLFKRIRLWSGESHKWLRNLGSTTISQFVDTAVFTTLAFLVLPNLLGGTLLPLVVAVEIMVAEYTIKLLLAVVDTPAFYGATHEQSV